jgi:dCTP deaminase
VRLPDGSGVLPDHLIESALGTIVRSERAIPTSNIQPASLDLRLGDRAFRLGCSFLPNGQPVLDKMKALEREEVSLRGGAILERNWPYLIPLQEELRLPRHIRARANPKSSTGRLDIFTRVITDGAYAFDDIAPGYCGQLFLEVVSRSFTIEVHEGLTLNQLRLMTADTKKVPDSRLIEIHKEEGILYNLRGRKLALSDFSVLDGFFMSLDLTSGSGGVGYRARRTNRLIDLSHQGWYEPEDFWDKVRSDGLEQVILDPEEFYLLLSAESVRIPPDFAAEMTAYDPTSGELRTHYAGFFDPGFGYDMGTLSGSRATLEVRAHDVPFMIESGQRVCKLTFEPMLARPKVLYGHALDSNYQGQTVTLSKHFRADRPFRRNQLRLPFPR